MQQFQVAMPGETSWSLVAPCNCCICATVLGTEGDRFLEAFRVKDEGFFKLRCLLRKDDIQISIRNIVWHRYTRKNKTRGSKDFLSKWLNFRIFYLKFTSPKKSTPQKTNSTLIWGASWYSWLNGVQRFHLSSLCDKTKTRWSCRWGVQKEDGFVWLEKCNVLVISWRYRCWEIDLQYKMLFFSPFWCVSSVWVFGCV